MQFTGYPSDEDTQLQFGVSFGKLKEAKIKAGNSNKSVQQFYDLNPNIDNYENPNITDLVLTDANKNLKLNNVDQHIVPSQDNTYDIGTDTKKWKSIYGHNYYDTNGAEFGFFKNIAGGGGANIVADYNDTLTLQSSNNSVNFLKDEISKKIDFTINYNTVQPQFIVTVGKTGTNAQYTTNNYLTEDLAFQAAINSISAVGGTVRVIDTNQTYTFQNSVTLYSNITLDLNYSLIIANNNFTGTNFVGGVIRPSLFRNVSGNATTTYFVTYTDTNIHIINGVLDGNPAGQTGPVGGIGFQNAKYCTVENCRFQNFGTLYTGVGPNLESRGVQFRNNFRSHMLRNYDFRTDGQTISISEECTIQDGVCEEGTSEGFFIGYANRCYVRNFKSYNCAGYGGHITGSGFITYDCWMVDCYSENCGNSGSIGQYDGHNISGNSHRCGAINCSATGSRRHGLLVDNSTEITVIGGQYWNNSQDTAGLYHGVRLNVTSNVIIDNVMCFDDQGVKTQGYGISEAGTCTNTKIGLGNLLYNNLTGNISQFGRSNIYSKVTFDSAPILSSILDTNEAIILGTTVSTFAVNYIDVQNNSTGFAPRISAKGADTNISLNFIPKGTGRALVNGFEIVNEEAYKASEGVNKIMGVATLVAGTTTINTTKVTAVSRIYLTAQTLGGTIGVQYISARVAGTSFTITSNTTLDTSTVAWIIIEPA